MTTRIGIHDSIEALFPPEVLCEKLATIDPEVAAVATEAVDSVDALVTFEYEDALLDTDLRWIHSVQSGVDRFPFDTDRCNHFRQGYRIVAVSLPI